MEMQKNFRSAFNGFNREDVVQYISYLNAKHAAEKAQLDSELEFLRNQSREAASAPDGIMEQQASRIRELFDQNKALEEALAQARAQIALLEIAAQEKDQAPEAQPCAEAELEAYRRAERMERVAKEKAERIYHQANGTLAQASTLVETASGQIGQLSEQVMEQLSQLRCAVGSSKQALADAATVLGSLRAESDTQ